MTASSSGLDAEVAVVGSGPAGWAAAAALAEVGVETVLVGPAPGEVWPATYGCWVDELEPIGLASIARTSWPSVRVVGHREHEVPRAYAVLDNAGLHEVLSNAFGRAGGRAVVGAAKQPVPAPRALIRPRSVSSPASNAHPSRPDRAR